jgi:1-aminocyclopropane-1-carboxylate deaminase/D-cysteine desulfhydrase-like pyridoxal-dependent ACC family enzyme
MLDGLSPLQLLLPFAKTIGGGTEASESAARLIARAEGILVDPIYTAKALAELIALAGSGELSGRRAVFWHAGGAPGIFEPPAP